MGKALAATLDADEEDSHEDILTSGDVEANPGPPPTMFFCPIEGCSRAASGGRRGWSDITAVKAHLRLTHLSVSQWPQEDWLLSSNLRVCKPCKELVTRGRQCGGPQCSSHCLWEALSRQLLIRPEAPTMPTGASSLNGPEPCGPVTCKVILNSRSNVMRRVSAASATQFNLGLAATLLALVNDKSWEALQRLLLFPKFALQGPNKGGKSRPNAQGEAGRRNCVRALIEPMDTLLQGMEQGSRPRRSERLRKRQLDDDMDEDEGVLPELSALDIDACRRLVSEGAPRKALQRLETHGRWDTKDPEVVTLLKSLHPTRPALPEPEPLDCDQPPQWPEEDYEAMKRVLTSFLQVAPSFPFARCAREVLVPQTQSRGYAQPRYTHCARQTGG